MIPYFNKRFIGNIKTNKLNDTTFLWKLKLTINKNSKIKYFLVNVMFIWQVCCASFDGIQQCGHKQIKSINWKELQFKKKNSWMKKFEWKE